MKTRHLLVAALAVVVLTGLGCQTKSTSTGPDGGVIKSADGGNIWSQIASLPSAKGVGSIASVDVTDLEMDPQDPRVIYLGTKEHGLFVTEDSGETWRQARVESLRTGAITAVEVDPLSVCTVYVAKGDRLYKTSDCGRSWNSEAYVETRPTVSLTRVAVDWYDSKNVWVGLSNGDVLKSEDGAATWRSVLSLDKSITSMLVSNSDSRIVLVSNRAGISKTIDGGTTWTSLKEDLKSFKGGSNVLRLEQDAVGTTVIASTQYGLLRSTDAGGTWNEVPLTTGDGEVTIYALGIFPSDANQLYYGAGDVFYRSTDAGQTWVTMKIPSTRTPKDLLINPDDVNTVYLGLATIEK